MRGVASEKLKVRVVTNASSRLAEVIVDVAHEFDLLWANEVASADIVILIVVHSVSYVLAHTVESAYDEATRGKKPVLIFEGAYGPRTAPTEGLLNRLRSEGQSITPFASPLELVEVVRQRISNFSAKSPPPPATPMSLEAAVAEIKATLASEIAVAMRGTKAAPEFASVWGPRSPVHRRSVFVIMPYSESWSVGLQKILIEVCAKTDMDYTIAKLMNGRFIPQDIWKGITRAAIVIADLSGANPNVTYEIGLADVLGKETILIAQNEKVPFDFVGQRLLIYSNTIEGGVRLREELIAHIEAMKKQRGEQE
jgi:hypothetical protein